MAYIVVVKWLLALLIGVGKLRPFCLVHGLVLIIKDFFINRFFC